MLDEEASVETNVGVKCDSVSITERASIEPLQVDDFQDAEGENDVHQNQGIRYYLLCILMGSLMTASSKLALKETDEFVVMFFRMLVTFSISLLWMMYNRTEHYFWGPPGLRRILLARGLAGTINLSLGYYAVQYMPLPDFSLLNFLAPLLTAVAAHLVLGEPYYWVQGVASCLSFCGVIIMTRPSFIFGEQIELPEGVSPHQHVLAVIAALCGVVGTTTIFLLLRTIGTRISPYTIVANYSLQASILSGCILMFKRIVWNEQIQIPSRVVTWLILAFIGIVGFAFQFLMNIAVARERASVLTQFDYIVLIYMMLWQFLLFHTLPDFVSLGGGVFIIAGVVWAARSRPVE